MRLLNIKSILDCVDCDVETHNKEIENILVSLNEFPDYDCAVIIQYFDELNRSKEQMIKSCTLHSCVEVVKQFDFKNGVDIGIEDNFLTFVCYGKEYVYNHKTHCVVVGIQIRPYDENRDFIDLFGDKYK